MAKGKVGRPRSEKSREAVLDATSGLLEVKGGAGLTIEAIAKRAGVGKPTLYRWWPSLADIVLEALLRQATAEISVPEVDSLEETLLGFLHQSMHSIKEGAGAHLRFLMAQAQRDEEFRQRFRENFVAKRREVLRSIFLQAVERGEIGVGCNHDLLVDMVFGGMWYRLLIDHAPLDEAFADEMTDLIMSLVRPESKA